MAIGEHVTGSYFMNSGLMHKPHVYPSVGRSIPGYDTHRCDLRPLVEAVNVDVA